MKKKSAPERLAAALQGALDAEPRDIDAARRVLESAIKDDAEVLWLILEPMRKSVLNELLRRHFAEKRSKTRNTERDKEWYKTGKAPKPRIKVRSHSRRAGVTSMGYLDIFVVPDLGRPLGDCRKEELVAVRDRRFASRDRFDTMGRFYDMVQAPLPPLGLARDHYQGDEIERWVADNAPHVPELNPREAA